MGTSVVHGLARSKMNRWLFPFIFSSVSSAWVPKQHRWIPQGQQDDLVFSPRFEPVGLHELRQVDQEDVRRQYLGRFSRDQMTNPNVAEPLRLQRSKPTSCFQTLLEGLSFLAAMRNPQLGQKDLLPLDQVDQMIGQQSAPTQHKARARDQGQQGPRAERSTDPRSQDQDPRSRSEDKAIKQETRSNSGPTLWRYKPAKRSGGWGNLLFTLLGGKGDKVREPNIADYYASRIGKKEINEVEKSNFEDHYDLGRIMKKEKTLVRLPWQMVQGCRKGRSKQMGAKILEQSLVKSFWEIL